MWGCERVPRRMAEAWGVSLVDLLSTSFNQPAVNDCSSESNAVTDSQDAGNGLLGSKSVDVTLGYTEQFGKLSDCVRLTLTMSRFRAQNFAHVSHGASASRVVPLIQRVSTPVLQKQLGE